MGSLHAEGVEQGSRVVGPYLHLVVLLGPVRFAVAAHVVVDAAKPLAENRRRRREVVVAKAGPVDLDDRFAVASDLVP